MIPDHLSRDGPTWRLRGLVAVLRAFALFALTTGTLDVVAGTRLLVGSGARLAAAAADPVLNSQVAYWGAVWGGFGAALWWTTRDLRGRAAPLRILLGAVFAGGLGRVLAAVQFGLGPPVLAALIVVELAGVPAVLAWHRRLLRRDVDEHRAAYPA